MTGDSPLGLNAAILQNLLDHQAIVEVVTRVANHADAHEWGLLRDCFADEVAVDYTSLAGGEPSCVRADDLIAGWRGTLASFDATQHLVTNFSVTLSGDKARCQTYVRAHHYLEDAPGGDWWLVVGRYDYGLLRQGGAWRVHSTKLTLERFEGNTNLADAARAHAAQNVARAE